MSPTTNKTPTTNPSAQMTPPTTGNTTAASASNNVPNTPPKSRAPYAKLKKWPAGERFVDIRLHETNEKFTPVAAKFPMSILMKYSLKAQAELPKLAEAKGTLIWSLWACDKSCNITGVFRVLTWLHDVLPAAGVSPNYKGHPQLDGTDLEAMTIKDLITVVLAIELLDFAPPLDKQWFTTSVLSDKISTCSKAPPVAGLLRLLHLEGTTYNNCFKTAVYRAVDWYDPQSEDDHASDAEMEELKKARAENPKLDEAMKDMEEKKVQRLEREEKRAKAKAWKARCEAREAAEEARYQRWLNRLEDAKNGLVMLGADEADAYFPRARY